VSGNASSGAALEIRHLAPAGPWERLHLDNGELEGRSFFAIVDAGTGWIEADWTSGPTTAAAVNLLSRVFRLFGLCRTVVSDKAGPLSARSSRNSCGNEGSPKC